MVPSILLKWMEISLVKMTPLMPYALSLMFWWQYLKLCQIDVCQSWWYLTTPPSFPLLRSDCDHLLWWQGCSKLKIEPTAVQQVEVRSTVNVLHSVWWEPELVERDWIVAPATCKPQPTQRTFEFGILPHLFLACTSPTFRLEAPSGGRR